MFLLAYLAAPESSSSAMHAPEHGNAHVHIVVDPHAGFTFELSQQTARILYDSSFEGDRERQEQGVDLRAIEPLAEQLARCDDRQLAVGR